MVSDAEILQQAQATLAKAILDLYPGTTVSRDSFANILGLVWGENKFGTAGDWQGSNNWGSLRCYRQDYGCVQHGDRDAQGNPVTVPFQRYPSQLEGAKGFLRTLLKTAAERSALSIGDPVTLARAMYAARYFTGTSGTDEERIQAYAGLIRRSANQVRTILGQSASSVVAPSATIRKTGLVLGVLALGVTGAWYLKKPRPRLRSRRGKGT
jgi:hypothetical protein